MTAELSVRHLADDQFVIDVRSHSITVDQPSSEGGQDSGPTPTELFVAGLASCVAFYARRYLARHDIPAEGLGVTANYLIGGRPARVTSITLHVTAPSTLPPERREAFLAVATHCTVHNTLKEPPPIEFTLSRSTRVRASWVVAGPLGCYRSPNPQRRGAKGHGSARLPIVA